MLLAICSPGGGHTYVCTYKHIMYKYPFENDFKKSADA